MVVTGRSTDQVARAGVLGRTDAAMSWHACGTGSDTYT
eukprot:SAG31_NODE_1685_length_7530_cov_9.464944_4_plen_38_part_00